MRTCVLWLGVIGLLLSTIATLAAQEGEKLTLAPRWDTLWLSPRLTANWVMLEYQNVLPKDSKTTGTLFFDLPAGVTCLWSGKLQFEHTPTDNGSRSLLKVYQVDLTQQQPEHRGHWFYFSTTLPPGTVEKARVWAQWPDGEAAVTEFPVRVIDTPLALQPKKIRTGVTMWPYQIDNWPDFAGQFASMGFNHVYYWHGVLYNSAYKLPANLEPDENLRRQVEQFQARNIITSVVGEGTWDLETVTKDPDAQALFPNGSRSGVCPSYRGPGFINAVEQNSEKVAKSGVSYILSDEEYYASGSFQQACLCPRCEALWKNWLPVHRPDLPYLSPREIIERRQELPEHLRAWWYFRASLTTNRYRIWRQELEKAVEKYDARSSPSPMLSWCVGAAEDCSLEYSMIDSRQFGQVLDAIMPQVYYMYHIPPRDFRKIVRRQCWAMDRKNTEFIMDSYDFRHGTNYANIPGVLLMGVLEVAFAGAQGYCMWYGPYMDTRQWTELAQANNVIAKYENVFLDGRETDLFQCFTPEPQEGKRNDFFAVWSDDVCTSTWENDQTGLLLITDYRQQRQPIWVERSRQYTGPLTLYDAFTDQKVAHLTEGQWEFYLPPQEESAVRLLYWTK